MKTRILRLLSLVAFAVPFSSFSQYSISGKITDAEGALITGAKISPEHTYSGALSDLNGQYKLTNLKNDTYQLTVTYIGYETQTVVVEISGKDVEKNIRLEKSAIMMEEVEVLAVRAGDKTPTTYTNLDSKQIEKSNFGQDLPYLLEGTPSTVVTSDAGAGVGYTGVRIRGVDPTRTNVTINGIPLNDAESHGVYWVDMPDFASSTDNIQIQRGVGTSSNGAAAFGASINIKSDNIERQAYGELDNAFGSYNTMRNTIKAGTGLINNKFTLDARASRVVSDGFINRASSNLNSYYLSGAWIGKKSLLKANIFSGNEKTYQAWYGVPGAKLSGDPDSLLNHFYNNYYPGGTYQTAQDSVNLFNSDPRKYNYYTYKNETDNYKQTHYQLLFTHSFNEKWTLNLAGHYTHGEGYYEQYRYNDDFSTYGLQPLYIGGDTINTTDLIRRRWLNNDFYGGIFSVTYNNRKNWQVIIGGGANNYTGKHYGEIIWARYASQSEINQHYYDDNATKSEENAYVKANYQLKKFNFFADMQVRHLNYSYLGNEQYFNTIIPMQQDITYTFFNPKAGLMYDLGKRSNLYASYSVANREPVRDDFVQSTQNSRPKSEQLHNVEAGYHFKSRKMFVNANYFLMAYKDQLILTGKINDVGAYNRVNVPKSYRTGIELEAGYMLTKKLSISGNLTLSANKIKEFKEYIDNYDTGIQEVVVHKNTDISFSPNTIASIALLYEPIKNLEFSILSKYVGKQYLDNTSDENRMLNHYYLTNLTMSYTIKNVLFKEMKVGLLINNIFNYKYENNGYTFSYIYGGNLITENYYFPQAGTNFLARLTIKL